jgi:hypothetical protein
MREFVYQIQIGCEYRSDAEVYVNQDKSLSDLQTLIKHSFLLNFPRELLMNFLIKVPIINNIINTSFKTVAKPARQFGHAMQIFSCSYTVKTINF